LFENEVPCEWYIPEWVWSGGSGTSAPEVKFKIRKAFGKAELATVIRSLKLA
jgi:hypothetical protein